MQPSVPKLAIDQLINIVSSGGKIRTGIDIFNRQGLLLLEQDVLVSDPKILAKIKCFGVEWIPIVSSNAGGIWDKDGKLVSMPAVKPAPIAAPKIYATEIDQKIEELLEMKGVAAKKYEQAKGCIKKVLMTIEQSGGKFDFEPVAKTVSELVDFIAKHDNAFSYLTREIFSFDDYLYNHSINVCTIATVIMKKFNENFSSVVNSFLNNASGNSFKKMDSDGESFSYFLRDELQDISTGFFLHDLGKMLIDKNVLNKPGQLTSDEFEVMKLHSIEKGLEILEKNNLANPYINNVSRYHHANLYQDEKRCYPNDKAPSDIPPYVKVCKLADIYDAMTSRRCYKEALNPVGVVTDIFRSYAEKDPLLQYILHSFVKSVGIYPPGSIVALTNGQLAYVLDSQGPTLLPLTNSKGVPLKGKPDLVVLEQSDAKEGVKVDRSKPPISPVEAYKILPDYLLKTVHSETRFMK